MIDQIKNIFSESISIKQQLLQDKDLINTIASSVDIISAAFKMGIRFYSVVMVVALQMHNT